MADPTTRRRGPWRAFLALPNDSVGKALGMALLVSLACAVAVSSAAIALAPMRRANAAALREASLRQALGAVPGLDAALVERGELEVRQVALATGPAEVRLLRRDGQLAALVLPVSGTGYQSVLRGFLVLGPDLSTIAALAIHDQAETPGVGSRVTDPAWLARFRGKHAFDARGQVALEIVKAGATGPHQVDGISGATRTTNGVREALSTALGPQGFGPWLATLKEARRDGP
jgi:Na+-transporting NADH:ubiquinone oxidoreductase subunit C